MKRFADLSSCIAKELKVTDAVLDGESLSWTAMAATLTHVGNRAKAIVLDPVDPLGAFKQIATANRDEGVNLRQHGEFL